MSNWVIIALRRISNFTNTFSIGFILTILTINLITKNDYSHVIFIGLIIIVSLFLVFNIFTSVAILKKNKFENTSLMIWSSSLLTINLTIIVFSIIGREINSTNAVLTNGILLGLVIILGIGMIIADVKSLLLTFKLISTKKHSTSEKK
ncbi:MAG: hypothetical protein ACRAS9_02670 [Mycoplasma sp.]